MDGWMDGGLLAWKACLRGGGFEADGWSGRGNKWLLSE